MGLLNKSGGGAGVIPSFADDAARDAFYAGKQMSNGTMCDVAGAFYVYNGAGAYDDANWTDATGQVSALIKGDTGAQGPQGPRGYTGIGNVAADIPDIPVAGDNKAAVFVKDADGNVVLTGEDMA